MQYKIDVWIYFGSSDRDLEFRKWLMEKRIQPME